MSLAIPTLAGRPRPHRRRRPISPPSPRGGVRRITLRFEWLEERTVLSTFTVTSIADAGPGSLRQAILDADAEPEGAVIDFAIPGDGVHTIVPISSLPAITESVLIDGMSQPGYAGTPLIELSGQMAGYSDGLTITGSHVTARGLDINGFQGFGIHVTGAGASDNWIDGDFLGTDPTGTQAVPNLYGIAIDGGAIGNLIGTDGDGRGDAGERNVISGNSYDIFIEGQGTNDNVVAGNLIGTDRTGTRSLGLTFGYATGVFIGDGAVSNRIGVSPLSTATIEDEGNVISGHQLDGVIMFGAGTEDNVVAGNSIGTDVTGTLPLPNGNGVEFSDGASHNTIGGTTADVGNLIANNAHFGVLGDDGSLGNSIRANRIFANTGPAIEFLSEPQAPPTIAQTTRGQLEGWLGGRTPRATFHLDFFASADFAADGSGQAERYLGSLEVTTDGDGQAVFEIPYAPPANQPILTATATDPQGSTSSISIQRTASLRAPANPVRLLPGQSRVFSASSGGAIALRQASAGPLDPEWSLTLSVAAGTLTLAGTDGLVGSGNGTGTLDYRGGLGALNAALDGLIYAPPAGFQGNTALDVKARSFGAIPLQERIPIVITSGTFLVTTTADSGPGSLRQAILDSDAAIGAMNTIAFAIPGTGLRTISPRTLLPPITTPTLLDGSSQPGFAGLPLIAIGGPGTGGAGVLTLGASVTVRALEFDSYRTITDESSSANEQLVARVHAEGLTTRLSLKDDQGRVLMQSDGQSAESHDDLININVPPGTFSLEVQRLGGMGAYTLTITLTPATMPVRTLPIGLYPFTIASGDFNGDGRPDLAATAGNGGVKAVSVLLGNGDGTFRPPVVYPVRGGAGFIVPGDFDGDGHLDLAVEGDGVSILLGNGDGTFLPPEQVAAGISGTLSSGDFDRDGHLDLAVFSDNIVSVLLGDGDGTFRPRSTVAVGAQADSIVSGDFNDDGRLDLAISNGYGSPGIGTVSVLLGDGDGTFRPQATYDVGEGPRSLVAGDFNGDGHLDLAIASDVHDVVSVLRGNGDGTFQPRVMYTAAPDQLSLVAGDFNGDGHLDLATTDFAANSVCVLLSDGDGAFRRPVTYAAGVETLFIVSADFNGDGSLDLAVTDQGNQGDFGTDPGGVSLLLGDGDGTFQPQLQAGNAVGAAPTSVVSGDFNGDGRLDMATANVVDDTVSVLLGHGDGTFQPQSTYAVGKGVTSILAGDFNGDGRLDLAAACVDFDYLTGTSVYAILVLLGDGDGTFRPPVAYPGVDPATFMTGDFNGDGHLDLAGAAPASGPDPGGLSVLLGDGDGTFQPPITPVPGGQLQSFVAGDFNGDGRLDLAEAGYNSSSSSVTTPYIVSVFLGKGDGTFRPPVHYAGISPAALVTGDFNGDGHPDLAVAGQDYNPLTYTYVYEISVLLGKGDGTFQPQVIDPVETLPYALVTGDFNGDGKVDLAGVDTINHAAMLLWAKGDGTFQPPVTDPVGGEPSSLVTGDFNGDGHPDLAVANESSGNVSLLLGEGDGAFADPGQFATTPHATPRVADVNGDGTEDVLVIDGSGNILYRQGQPGRPGSFDPPVTINPGAPARDLTPVTLKNQGSLIASVDARDAAVSFYAWRGGGFVRVGSLATGGLPAQVVAADLNGDGRPDLVVRNSADGTLSILFGVDFNQSTVVGPINPRFVPLGFQSPATLSTGPGVSDVQAIDTTGTGLLDLLITNELTGQLSILRNLGSGIFATPEPYRAGAGQSVIDLGSESPRVTSLEATAGVAVGRFTAGGQTDLVTINPGSKTLGLLAGLGRGRFANPIAIYTGQPARVLRVADFNGDGIGDLAVLTAEGLSIDLGDGQGHFAAPVVYDAGLDPTGLTVADLDHDGHLDLLVGDPYGDVLVLLGRGGGSFRPYRQADQSVALVVADLNGDGKPDFVYADQSLDRVSVQYGGDQTAVLGDQATGLLSPGAVALADLTGDGIPDLIVADSGSNNILVYPGEGDGQFAPAANGGHGFFTGTNPTGIAVADLNGDGLADLLVANSGSNDVSVLLGQGSGPTWTMTPGPRIKTDAGPVAVATGDILGTGHTDLAVANRQANTVQVFPGLGGGFFDDQRPRTYPVGQAPSDLFLGNFDGRGTEIAALNAGSNTLSLIGQSGVTQTIAAGGLRPTSGFAGDFNGDGLTDLVVGHSGDGRLALLLGEPGGLSLSQTLTSAAVPSPTSLSFAGVSDGVLDFYAASAGREAASLLAFNLQQEGAAAGALPGAELASGPVASAGAVLASATAGAFQQVAQLLSANGTTLSLVAPLFTVTVLPGEFEAGASSEGGVVLLANFLPGTGPGAAGQGVVHSDDGPPGEAADDTGPAEEKATAVVTTPQTLPPWEEVAMGLKRAWEQVRAEVLERAGLADGDSAGPVAAPGRPSSPAPAAVRPADRPRPRPSAPPQAEAPLPSEQPSGPKAGGASPGEARRGEAGPGPVGVTDAAIEELTAEGRSEVGPSHGGAARWIERLAAGRGGLTPPIATAAAMASAAAMAWAIHAARSGRRAARGPSRPVASTN